MIVNRVRESFSEDDADLLMLSSELDEINHEEVAWQKLVKSGFNKEKALRHLKKFPWLFQNSMTFEETISELNQRFENHVFRDIEAEKNELRLKQGKILRNHQNSLDDVDTLHKLALLRPEVKGCWAATGYYAKKLFDEISRRFSVDAYTLTFFYRSEDVDALLSVGRILSAEEIEKRKLATAYIIENGLLHSVVGEEALRLEKLVLGEKEKQKIVELYGQGARKGPVKGRVRILKINDPRATKEFRDNFHGEILVTSMTQPNVVDIVRRASAIITDEGGMLSHAAVISREFGIPCIVGTHIATQALKDGDLVEVDADHGVVRILEKAEN